MSPKAPIGSAWRRIELEHPIVQAGMGGGIAGSELAAAVSTAGGLGTLGFSAPERLTAEIRAVRERTTAPVAVNILFPFVRSKHWAAAAEADVVVTFWGAPRRQTDRVWLHQCGSVGEAQAALAAGADAVIAQGVEAGGHVRGEVPALQLLERIRGALGRDVPVLLAGGVASREDTETALAAGADAVVAGTRFLLTEESGASNEYRRRLESASETVRTDLFGVGWPAAPHRVVRNDATERWLAASSPAFAPPWVRTVHRILSPAARALPLSRQPALAGRQSPRTPLLSPQPPAAGLTDRLCDTGPLYAGETVARIDSTLPTAEALRALSPRSLSRTKTSRPEAAR